LRRFVPPPRSGAALLCEQEAVGIVGQIVAGDAKFCLRLVPRDQAVHHRSWWQMLRPAIHQRPVSCLFSGSVTILRPSLNFVSTAYRAWFVGVPLVPTTGLPCKSFGAERRILRHHQPCAFHEHHGGRHLLARSALAWSIPFQVYLSLPTLRVFFILFHLDRNLSLLFGGLRPRRPISSTMLFAPLRL